jgi:hypothetical protein
LVQRALDGARIERLSIADGTETAYVEAALLSRRGENADFEKQSAKSGRCESRQPH